LNYYTSSQRIENSEIIYWHSLHFEEGIYGKKNPAVVSLFILSELRCNCKALGVHEIQELEDMPKLLSVLARED
jgi:hypothetical protein